MILTLPTSRIWFAGPSRKTIRMSSILNSLFHILRPALEEANCLTLHFYPFGDSLFLRMDSGIGDRTNRTGEYLRPQSVQAKCSSFIIIVITNLPICHLSSRARFNSRTFTTGSPNNPSQRPSAMLRDHSANLGFRKSSDLCHSMNLVFSSSKTDMRVETAAGCCYEVNRYFRRIAGVSCVKSVDPCLHCLHQIRIIRSEVRT